MKKKYLAVTAILFLMCLVVVLRFIPKGAVEADSGHRVTMGTFGRVVAVAQDSDTAQRAITAAFKKLERVEDLMNVYDSNSGISKVNRQAFESPVSVNGMTFDVLKRSVEISKLTDGAFDITVGPLVELWRRAADANSVPDDTELEKARSKIGYERLVLDANEMTVKFAVDGMKLDLGGIAKGYAIDRAVEALKAAGAIGGMVDVGGDIRCFGRPAKNKKFWLIGLQHPAPGTADVLLTLKLTDNAVATSGDYERFVMIGGRRYSHIFNAQTGRSSNSLSSVTIVSQNAAEADALATAVSVLGIEKGIALIEKTPETEAILIGLEPDYKLIKTSRAKIYIE